MALRLKTRFRNRGPKTIDDRANVVGYNLWKVTQETYRRLVREDFKFKNPEQVAGLLTEVAAFLVQAADRLVYSRIPESDRTQFVVVLGTKLADVMQENLTDLHGPADYRTAFLRTLNARFADYAEFSFDNNSPSYAMVRYFGEKCADVLGTDNKWVVEQVMDIEAPEAMKPLRRLIHEVLGLKVH